MIDGIINVYKEKGYTSFDVVARLRGILKQKKIGHTGTLDPMAEGVLMVCCGKATKLVDMLTSGDKEYKAGMKLGISTDTEDITGKIISSKEIPDNVNEKIIYDTIKSFVGTYEQLPPMYSAIKINGKKLYEYARAGVSIERTARKVNIYDISDIKINIPDIYFNVHCSKGTYIRSLCRDIGDKLQTGGTMTSLIRQDVHGFTLDNALKLDDIEQLYKEDMLDEHILPVDALISDYVRYDIKENYSKYLLNGNKLYRNQINKNSEYVLKDKELIRIYHKDDFVAIYEYNANEDILKPYKMFLG